ncbi:NADH dehydrogenase [ubiquinone] iron-sulfur protein 5 [Turdus rufiventris]|nr:NADH dehydrogenase [ubiquinone] iron-sulfur protein 5 [Turdus rufiventris]
MPFWGLQKQLGIDVDSWLALQSMQQLRGQAAACHTFEHEWVECRHGQGQTCAHCKCQLQYEDFMECMKRTNLAQWLWVILKQRDSMIKQGKYTPLNYHTGKEKPRP